MKIHANNAREWGGGRGKAPSGTILRATSAQNNLVSKVMTDERSKNPKFFILSNVKKRPISHAPVITDGRTDERTDIPFFFAFP